MSRETYEIKQPWVVYTYLTADPQHEEAFTSEILMECCVCGASETVRIEIPALRDEKPVPHGYKHPQRVVFLAAHCHTPLPHALTWAKPLRNPAAHNESGDVLETVWREALRAARERREEGNGDG